MKKFLVFIASIFLLFGCTEKDDCIALNSNPDNKMKSAINWHDLTQSQKDDQIINTAYSDNGLNVGIQCKPWVQQIVSSASNSHVSVPLTKANQYQWNNDPSGHILGRSTLIENVARADIIQMFLYFSNGSTSPHTAIVVSKDSSGMTWIDSNWVGTNTVGTHYISFSSFYNMAANRYTVYHVQ